MEHLQSKKAISSVSDRNLRLASLAVLVIFATVFTTNWLKHHWDGYKVKSALGMLHIPNDNTALYYGPIIRRVDQLPTPIHDLVCYNSEKKCPADPGQPFSGGDLVISGLPTNKLIWFRRMGDRYLLRMSSASEAGPIEGIDIYALSAHGKIKFLSNINEQDFVGENISRLPAKIHAIGRLPPVVHTVLKTHYEQVSCDSQKLDNSKSGDACKNIGWPLR